MTLDSTEDQQSGRPRWLVPVAIGAGALVLAAVVWAAVASGASDEDAAPTTSASSSATVTSTPEPEPSASPTTPPSTEPAPAPSTDPEAPFVPGTEPAVPLTSTAEFGTGMSARVAGLESVAGVAEGPGEVAGPSVRVSVVLTNGTGAAASLDSTVVNLYAGEQLAPGEPLSGPGVSVFTGTLAPGASATGVYVFRVPPDLRDHLQITVSYDPTATTVLFEGPGPAA
ncbi:hypothetical protein [Cellulomonas terrae]|uniref:DUF4352 domain-containing protein n=1 Tax=Cellulomonas terrae TaxID=311234 RepID=A0A511JKA5_9CELL|nr:hypothetical protein [Cellulomonas terrae]GEL98441.1 hypothetical protein CTE05_19880 [Cellulomonas terrae]